MAARIGDPVVWIGKRGFPPSSQSRQDVYVRYILARFRVLPVTAAARGWLLLLRHRPPADAKRVGAEHERRRASPTGRLVELYAAHSGVEYVQAVHELS